MTPASRYFVDPPLLPPLSFILVTTPSIPSHIDKPTLFQRCASRIRHGVSPESASPHPDFFRRVDSAKPKLCDSDRRNHPRKAAHAAIMVYVRQEKLPNLKQYKYSSVDHSLTSKYILKPFYNNVVIKCFPTTMAPNLITLTGFSFVIANLLTLLWYNPTLDQDCPPWVYYSWAAGLFLYQTFDAVDGTQAYVSLDRRCFPT